MQFFLFFLGTSWIGLSLASLFYGLFGFAQSQLRKELREYYDGVRYAKSRFSNLHLLIFAGAYIAFLLPYSKPIFGLFGGTILFVLACIV